MHPLCYLCLCGVIVSSLSLIWEVVGSRPILFTKTFDKFCRFYRIHLEINLICHLRVHFLWSLLPCEQWLHHFLNLNLKGINLVISLPLCIIFQVWVNFGCEPASSIFCFSQIELFFFSKDPLCTYLNHNSNQIAFQKSSYFTWFSVQFFKYISLQFHAVCSILAQHITAPPPPMLPPGYVPLGPSSCGSKGSNFLQFHAGFGKFK